MRLSQLDAQFIGQANATERSYHRQGNQIDGAQGIMFQCPACAVGKEPGEEDGRHFFRGAHYILVWFSNPRNAPPVPAEMTPTPRWQMSGDSLETLTTEPSILLHAPCNWHGYIRSGEAA